jgi:hypothetical protein
VEIAAEDTEQQARHFDSGQLWCAAVNFMAPFNHFFIMGLSAKKRVRREAHPQPQQRD